jgi:hypothetical protein
VSRGVWSPTRGKRAPHLLQRSRRLMAPMSWSRPRRDGQHPGVQLAAMAAGQAMRGLAAGGHLGGSRPMFFRGSFRVTAPSRQGPGSFKPALANAGGGVRFSCPLPPPPPSAGIGAEIANLALAGGGSGLPVGCRLEGRFFGLCGPDRGHLGGRGYRRSRQWSTWRNVGGSMGCRPGSSARHTSLAHNYSPSDLPLEPRRSISISL